MNKPHVELVDYTGMGFVDPALHAAMLLLETRMTRLTDNEWSEFSKTVTEEILDTELQKASKTIASSWEFIHYTFQIKHVSRAFTHQLVRHRHASFAQQSLRVVDINDLSNRVNIPASVYDAGIDAQTDWEDAIDQTQISYENLIDRCIPKEDARALLPIGTQTNIMMGLNLRSLSEMAMTRNSPRVQGEYRQVLEQMVNCALGVHGWTKYFLHPDRFDAVRELENLLKIYFIGEQGRTDIYRAVDKAIGQKILEK